MASDLVDVPGVDHRIQQPSQVAEVVFEVNITNQLPHRCNIPVFEKIKLPSLDADHFRCPAEFLDLFLIAHLFFMVPDFLKKHKSFEILGLFLIQFHTAGNFKN